MTVADTTNTPTAPQWVPHGHPVAVAITVLVALTVAFGAAAVTGAVTPDLRVQANQWTTATAEGRGSPVVRMDVTLTSLRSMAVRIEQVGESLPGLDLLSTARSDRFGGRPAPFRPTDLHPHDQGLQVQLTYRITRCASIPRGHLGLAVRARSGAGLTTTRRPRLVIGDRPDAPALRTYSGTDPYDEPWQITLTRKACAQ